MSSWSPKVLNYPEGSSCQEFYALVPSMSARQEQLEFLGFSSSEGLTQVERNRDSERIQDLRNIPWKELSLGKPCPSEWQIIQIMNLSSSYREMVWPICVRAQTWENQTIPEAKSWNATEVVNNVVLSHLLALISSNSQNPGHYIRLSDKGDDINPEACQHQTT